MDCLAEQTIARYVQGELDDAACDAVETHIDTCSDCRLAIAESARGRHPPKMPPPCPDAAVPVPTRLGVQLRPGDVLGRFIVRRVVGAGGMGIVYAAYDPKLDRDIALKLLRPEHLSVAEERLDREAKLMARLAHPNVITIYDVGAFSGQIYVAMELVIGETLGDTLRRSPELTWREVLTSSSPPAAARRRPPPRRRPPRLQARQRPRRPRRPRPRHRLLASPASRKPPTPSPKPTPLNPLSTPQPPLTRTGALLGTL